MSIKCASFFAGVGGIDKGFELAGFQIIFANEYDKNARTTYELNFPNTLVDHRDIRELNEKKDIPDFDVLLAGFPCQAFSIAGLQQGFDDDKGRGNLFFELVRIIKKKQPKVIFLENVKNLLSHDNGNTFAIISKELSNLGYHIKSTVLNSAQYGNIPQSRERIYIICFKNQKHHRSFDFPQPLILDKKLKDVIDFGFDGDIKLQYTKKCPFYDQLVDALKSSDTCYQWRRVYVRENKSKLCPTLTANMGMGGHNVPIIKTLNGKIRKLSTRECFNLQGFPSDFLLPETLATSALYKQAGNSVVVTVIERIAKKIIEVLR